MYTFKDENVGLSKDRHYDERFPSRKSKRYRLYDVIAIPIKCKYKKQH